MALGLPKFKGIHRLDKVNASDSVTLYLKVNENWKMHDARYAAYVWMPEAWFDLTLATGETDIYQVTIPNNGQTGLIFVRMNPATPENNWNNKWNQSSDLVLTFPMADNMYVLEEGEWEGDIGYWTKYSAQPSSSEVSSSEDSESSTSEEIPASLYVFHYWRNDGKTNDYSLWLWGEDQEGSEYEFDNTDAYGVYHEVTSSKFKGNQYLNIII